MAKKKFKKTEKRISNSELEDKLAADR